MNIENDISERFYGFDKRGVRAFVKYASNGCWSIECYRRKRKDESEGNHDWRMIRVGHIPSYYTRREAELIVLELAEEICKENGF